MGGGDILVKDNTLESNGIARSDLGNNLPLIGSGIFVFGNSKFEDNDGNRTGSLEIIGGTINATDGDATGSENFGGIVVQDNSRIDRIERVTFGTVEDDAVRVQGGGNGPSELLSFSEYDDTFDFSNVAGDVLDVASGSSARLIENDLSGSTPPFTPSELNFNGETKDLSGNWWGSTDPSTVASTAGSGVDYTPFLTNGTDQDGGTPGFQGEFSTLTTDSGSPQVGATTRQQEAVDLGATTVQVAQTDGTASYPTFKIDGTPFDFSTPTPPVRVDTLTFTTDPSGALPSFEATNVFVNNDITFDGSDGTITVTNGEIDVAQSVSSITNSPTFDVQRRFTGTDGPGNDAGWRLLASPRAATTGGDIDFQQASSGSILYTWNGDTQAFEQETLTSSSDLSSGEGYFLYLFDIAGRDQIDADPATTCGTNDACLSASGPLDASSTFPTSETFGTADVTVNIPASDNATQTEAGYVLGNPFAQSFDLSNLTLDDNGTQVPLGQAGLFQATVQAWNPQKQQFEPITADAMDDQVAPWQGFWILRQPSAPIEAATLTFESGGRTSGAPFIPQKASSEPVGRLYVDLRLENGGTVVSESRASVLAHSAATTGEDGFDASRIAPPVSEYAQVSFVRDDGTRKVQESLPYELAEAVEVPLHTEAVGVSGTATITTSDWQQLPPSWSLTLEDTETGAQVPLEAGQTYTFDLSQTAGERSEGGPSGGVQSGTVDPRFVVRVGPNAPLPVELSKLTGRADGTAAVLSWQTASETNNAGFRVQKKRGEAFETVTFVEGAGTTAEAQRYRARVPDLDYGEHVFRLKQVDIEGTEHVLKDVTVDVGLEGAYDVSAVAPNPVSQSGHIEVAVKTAQSVTVTAYDVLGRRVATLQDGVLEAETTHRIGISPQGWSSGQYFLRVKGEHFQTVRRAVVVR
jgi:hypothetical protein